MLTDKQTKKLIEDILKKLVLDCGIECPSLVEDIPLKGRKENFIDASSSLINSNRLGDFRHIIARYQVDVRIWLNSCNDPSLPEFMATPHFSYEHIPSGRNGHDMDFQISGKINDPWQNWNVENINKL